MPVSGPQQYLRSVKRAETAVDSIAQQIPKISSVAEDPAHRIDEPHSDE